MRAKSQRKLSSFVFTTVLTACGGGMAPPLDERMPAAAEVAILASYCLALEDLATGRLLFEDEHTVALQQVQDPRHPEVEFKLRAQPMGGGGAPVHYLCATNRASTAVALPLIDEPHRIVLEVDGAPVPLDVWVLTTEDWSLEVTMPSAKMFEAARIRVTPFGPAAEQGLKITTAHVDARVPNAVSAEHLELEDTRVVSSRSGQVILRVSATLANAGAAARDRVVRTVYVTGRRDKCPTFSSAWSQLNSVVTITIDQWSPARLVGAQWSLYENNDPEAGGDDPGWQPRALHETPSGDPPLSLTLDLADRRYAGRRLKLVLTPEFDAEYTTALAESELDVDCNLNPGFVFGRR